MGGDSRWDSLSAALQDFQAFPGRYSTASREPRILFDRVTDVLTLAADRSVEGLPKDGDLALRLREAARFFVRAAMLRHGLDHYALLGVQPGFDAAVLREHYRMLIRMTHPDFASNLNEWPADAATRINLANDVLGSAERRQAYDESLARKPQFVPVPIPTRRRPAMKESAGWSAKTLASRWPYLLVGISGALLLTLALWPAESSHERLAKLAREMPMERPAQNLTGNGTATATLAALVPDAPLSVPAAKSAGPDPGGHSTAVAAMADQTAVPADLPPSGARIQGPATTSLPAPVLSAEPKAAVLLPAPQPAASAAMPAVGLRSVEVAVVPEPLPKAKAPDVLIAKADHQRRPDPVTVPRSMPAAAPVETKPSIPAVEPRMARATAAAPTIPVQDTWNMRLSRTLANAPVTASAVVPQILVEPSTENRLDLAASTVTAVASRPAHRPVADLAVPAVVVSPAVAVAAPPTAHTGRNRSEAADSVAATGLRMSDVQPLLAQLLGALQNGRGDQAARLVDRSARPDDSRFSDAFSRMLSGSRVLRLGQVQFVGRPNGEQMVVDGVIQFQVQDASQQVFTRDFVLRAQFASRAGQTVMMQLVAGESSR